MIGRLHLLFLFWGIWRRGQGKLGHQLFGSILYSSICSLQLTILFFIAVWGLAYMGELRIKTWWHSLIYFRQHAFIQCLRWETGPFRDKGVILAPPFWCHCYNATLLALTVSAPGHYGAGTFRRKPFGTGHFSVYFFIVLSYYMWRKKFKGCFSDIIFFTLCSTVDSLLKKTKYVIYNLLSVHMNVL